MASTKRTEFSGPALFSFGFRPFFLLAGVFAILIIPLWMLIFGGRLTFNAPFPTTDWHIHEMLFGYTSAVITGFLFTAIPNWTGRMPIRGWPLALLAAIWLAGRLAMIGALGLGPIGVLLVDCAFLVTFAAIIAREIISGRNWKNLIVLAPVTVLTLTNIGFHLEVMQTGTSDISRRLGFAVVIFLITLIGGRIIPSFTRNWMAKQGPGPLPIPFNRFDLFALIALVFALALWALLPETLATGGALFTAALLHLIRLSRWRGWLAKSSFLLVMLHLAYLFIPFGLVSLAVGNASLGFHLLGIGAIGGMTIAVMMRATLGHSGRPLEAGFVLSAAFCLLIAAAFIRGFLAEQALFGLSGLWVATLVWSLAFAAFIWRVGPWLIRPKTARKLPSKAL